MTARASASKKKTRTYTLKKRAESQAQTRQRIVEAAVDLHSSVGPAATTFSMVADRAGVQRHTLYAHFPDERSLLLACSGYTAEHHPPPNAELWRGIADNRERLRTGLMAIYGWFERNAPRLGCVLRDAESHPLVREISAMRIGPHMAAYREVLGARLNARQRAMLQLALSFYTWRTLVREGGLTQADAVEAMVQAIDGAAGD
ncbi:MAG: TetR/AcrR family transcriptional regulator [Pseudorhodoplanes sp.]|nr:TetR/AcrR family transcriptional regulator [Pseudorhodoplanes sp.]